MYEHGITCHHAGPCDAAFRFWPAATSPASVCVHEDMAKSESVLLSTARSGSPPQPTVDERAAPHCRAPAHVSWVRAERELRVSRA